VNDLDSLRLALEAEKHNHRIDNEYLIGAIEDATRDILPASFTEEGVELWLTRHADLTAVERLQRAIGTLGMVGT
jgi:hypothetical protein